MSVFANGREISGKATPNKTIAAFPDVCMSPPSPPAGPLPLPYPLTSMASNTDDGTGSVKIKGKEIGKKNGSVYSKCNGNEPATRTFGAGLISHTITGKTKFAAYSFDVFLEKGGAERFMDITMSNHMSPTESAPGPSVAAENPSSAPPDPDCVAMTTQNRDDFDAAKSGAEGEAAKRFDRAKSDDQPGITIAQAVVEGGGMRSGTSSATVRELVQKFRDEPNNPLKSSQRTTVDGKGRYAMDVCPPEGTDYHHPTGMEHAEIHIFNSVAGLGGPARPKLTFGIEWRESYKGQLKSVRHDACPVCQKAIAHACKCFAIYICDSKGQPKPQCPQDQPSAPSAPSV